MARTLNPYWGFTFGFVLVFVGSAPAQTQPAIANATRGCSLVRERRPKRPAVTIANVTRGGSSSFFDGDGFTITLTGAPNAAVTVSQTRDGVVASTNLPEGTTDSSGVAKISGYILGIDAGSWTETWFVAGAAAPTIAFTVGTTGAEPILQPGAAETLFLYNSSYQADIYPDYRGLPYFFYYVNVNTDPPRGIYKQTCSLETNPGTGYVPSGPIYWHTFPYPSGGPITGATLAAPGNYMQSQQFRYSLSRPYYETTGFTFNGEFIGQASSVTTQGQDYTEAAYVSDRACFDAGTEYGWYRLPAAPQNQAANVISFYYSEFTNCNLGYVCENASGNQVDQSTNTYTVTLNSINSTGTYQFNYRVFRTTADFGSGPVSWFVLSITDPQTGSPAPCAVTQDLGSSATTTGVAFTNPGYCSDVFVGIDLSWYPSPAVSNTGYVTFADNANNNWPANWFGPDSPAGLAPPTNVVPTTYPDGHTAAYAGFNVISAAVLYQ